VQDEGGRAPGWARLQKGGVELDAMGRPKEEVRRLLDLLPDEASYEDIQYEIYVRQAVDRGIEAADRGELVEQEEIERRMSKWLGT
jgi:predicted transcriptional regulator